MGLSATSTAADKKGATGRGAVRSRPVEVVFVVALIVLGLLYATIQAALHGTADFYARPATAYLVQRQVSETPLTDEEWQLLEARINRAVQLAPDNPEYLANLASLHQVRLNEQEELLDIEAMNLHATAAYELYRQAAAERPTWPYYWGNLALELYRRGRTADDAYSLALSNAARFGPWTDDTQRLVIELGVDTWEYLDLDARLALLGSIDRALLRQPALIVALVDAYGEWEAVCDNARETLDDPGGYAQLRTNNSELRDLQDFCDQFVRLAATPSPD